MSHATAEEIHDHAYGFRLSEHIAGCAECGRAADAVAAERQALCDVLEEDPASAPPELFQRLAIVEPKRRRIGSAPLAAAAILLAALAWVLFQPRGKAGTSEVASPPPTQETEIERLIGELKNSKPRSELAGEALRTYGASAVEPLTKARAPSALIDECRGIPIADQNVLRKLKEKAMGMDATNASLTAAVDFIREISGVNFHIVDIQDPEGIKITLKHRFSSAYECLEALSEITNIPFSIRDGGVCFGRKQPAPESWAPVRFSPRIEAAKELVALLKEGKPREQEQAVEGLRKLGFSAESVLWELLDSPDLGVQSQAAHLLRTLYTRGAAPGVLTPFPPKAAAVVKLLETWKGDIDFTNALAAEVVADLSARSGLSILIDPKVDMGPKRITFKVRDLALKNIVKLLLSQFQLDFYAGDGWILVTTSGCMRLSNPGPVWLSPKEAGAAQELLLQAVSPDAATREAARRKLLESGGPALAWLGSAADASPPADAATYRALQGDLADRLNVWVVDRPSGVDLQTLTEAQQAVLARPMAAGQKGLENLPVVVKSPGEVRVVCATTPGLRMGSFLKAITRIQGLDIHMVGNEIFIDTAAEVRKIVEK